jgi:hypothetical protein
LPLLLLYLLYLCTCPATRLSVTSPPLSAQGYSGADEFDQGEAECRDEKPGPCGDEHWLPAFCPQFAKIRLEAHRGEGDREKKRGRLNEVGLAALLWPAAWPVPRLARGLPWQTPDNTTGAAKFAATSTRRKSVSHQTRRWRKKDSNPQSLSEGKCRKTVSTSGFVFTGDRGFGSASLRRSVMLAQTAAMLGFSARTTACLASCSFDPAVCNSASRRLALSRCSCYRSAFDRAISQLRYVMQDLRSASRSSPGNGAKFRFPGGFSMRCANRSIGEIGVSREINGLEVLKAIGIPSGRGTNRTDLSAAQWQ